MRRRLRFAILVLGAALGAFSGCRPAQDSPAGAQGDPLAQDDSAPGGIVELRDTTGRPLRCEVLARKADHLLVKREADSQQFLLHVSLLDKSSRAFVKGVSDFNESQLDEVAFVEAKRTLVVDLCSVQVLSTSICRLNGRTLTTSYGHEVQFFRDFLRENGVRYKEVSIPTTREADGSHTYSLPEGVSNTPFIRIGGRFIDSLSPKALRKSLIDSILAPNRTS